MSATLPEKQRPVSRANFRKHSDEPNHLALVVETHKDLGIILSRVIDHVFKEDHFVELDQLSFPIKVDLAEALSILPRQVRSPLLKLNGIRNSFAHGQMRELDADLVRDWYNTFDSPYLRYLIGELSPSTSEHVLLFRQLVSVLYVDLTGAYEKLLIQDLVDEATHEEVVDVLQHVRRGSTHEVDRSIASRVERLKRERWTE